MTLSYTYRVLSTDLQAGGMTVRYEHNGFPPVDVGVRLPIAGEPLEAVIMAAAPSYLWTPTPTLVAPDVGTQGTIGPAATTALEMVREARLAELAGWRYGIETGGITVGGFAVKTDRESQAQIAGAFTTLKEGFVPFVDFKGDAGTFTRITLAQITPIAQAVAQHVQMCFSAEKLLADNIALAATVEEVQAVQFPEMLA